MKKLKTLTLNGVTYALDTPDVEELTDIREGFDGKTYDTAGQAVRAQVGSIEKRFEPSRNLIDPERIIAGKYDNGGVIASNTSYRMTELIPVKPSTAYVFSWVYSSNFYATSAYAKCRFVSYYDSQKTYLSKETAEVNTFTTPEKAAYVRITMYDYGFAKGEFPMLIPSTNATYLNRHRYSFDLNCEVSGEKIKDRSLGVEKLSKDVITCGKNLFDKSAAVSGILGYGAFEIQEGNYMTSNYIPVRAGQAYTCSPAVLRYKLFDSYKDQLIMEQPDAAKTIIPEQDGFLRVSVRNANFETFQIEKGETATAYEPFMRVLSPDIHVTGIAAAYDYKNMLTGKKWYACGDSFTADGYGTSDQPKFEEGLYTGKNKVYPFYIGRRCGIDVTNLAVGGQTMAKVEGRGNCFSEDIYQSIGADADYITIRLGINDDNQNVPIGTIDDSDNTTFYGAWNVVMEHLITNHPFAHIGIIISNGMDLEYAEAVKAIAVKWGIPYLDFATGEQVPLMHRTCRTDVTGVARTARHNAFIISSSNTHPNADAHEYESYCIESWLMRL